MPLDSLPLEEVVLDMPSAAAVCSLLGRLFFTACSFVIKSCFFFEGLGSAGLSSWGRNLGSGTLTLPAVLLEETVSLPWLPSL